MLRFFLLIFSVAILFSKPAFADDQKAVPISRPMPTYPVGAEGMSGHVLIYYTIDASGHVINPKIGESSPTGVFDEAALSVLSSWRYKPRTVDGKAVMQGDNGIKLEFEPSSLPQLIYMPEIFYPRGAYFEKIEGEVKAKFDVDASGQVQNIEIVSSKPHGIFDDDVKNYLGDALFQAAILNGVPQYTTGITYTFPFKLDAAKIIPTIIYQPKIHYPRGGFTEGFCIPEVRINQNGRVAGVSIVRQGPGTFFEQTCLEAARNTQFAPLQSYDKSVIQFIYRFRCANCYSDPILLTGQWIRIQYSLLESGQVANAVALQTSGPDVKTSKVLEAFSELRYTPRLQNGKVVRVDGLVTLQSGGAKSAPSRENELIAEAQHAYQYEYDGYWDAKNYYMDALKINPNSFPAHRWLAALYFDQAMYDKAIQEASELIRIDPESYMGYNDRCESFLFIQQLDRALEDCNRSIALNPAVAKNRDTRATLYLKMGKLDLALADFQKALLFSPRHDYSLYGLGIVYALMGNMAESQADIKLASSINDRLKRYYHNAGLSVP